MTLDDSDIRWKHPWWGRPGGGREVLRVAVPLVVSSLSWTIMTFFDRMLLNWVSGDGDGRVVHGVGRLVCDPCFAAGNLFVCEHVRRAVRRRRASRIESAWWFGRRSGSRLGWARCR